MPLREDILAVIPGDNPSGPDLRYDSKLLIFDKIKEARRQDDDLNQGAWLTERKVANWPLVITLAQDALATTSKDLQLAAFLSEALLQAERFAGLLQGLELTYQLLVRYWDTIHPNIEDGDRELRAAPLAWIGSALDLPVRSVPLVTAGYSEITYRDSQKVGYEDQAKTDKERKARNDLLNEGKIAPEVFDKAFGETPKAFYLQTEKDLDNCLETLLKLETLCDEKFESDAPSFNKLRKAVTDVRRVVHQLLEKKRETEPDPVEEAPPVEQVASPGEGGEAPSTQVQSPAMAFGAEPADMKQAVAMVVAAASFMRKKDNRNPAPYLLLRGMRWGELRSAERLADSPMLEAPPTELRQLVKRLAIAKKWAELLEAGENALAHPGSRAWLDLQRLSVTACSALGSGYTPIATAIVSELRALLNDIPELIDSMLLDDTPAANPETKEWLRSLATPVEPQQATEKEEAAQELNGHRNGTPTWLAHAVDPYVLAKDALTGGQEEKAFAIMRAEIAKQRSGRRRFRRIMQMVELAIAAGKDGIAQPLLEDVAATIEAHKLDAWEDPELIASDLSKLMRYSKKIQGNAGDKQKIFERICRLDPVQALNVS